MTYEKVALRRLFRIVNGGTPKPGAGNWDGPVDWATPVDLGQSGQYLQATDRTITEAGLREGSRRVPAGSIVLSTRAPIGHLSIASRPLAFNQGCRALVPRAPLDVRFFAYQLLVMRPDLEAAGAGSTFKELSSDALAETRVFRPALDEQQRIAEYLDVETTRIDRLISANARLSALVSERWQATLASAVTGQTGGRSTKATGNPFLPTVAADWRVCRLKHLASRVDVGIAEAATHAYADQGVPLLRSMNIRPNRLDTSDVLFIDPLFDARNHRKRVKANDILTVRTGNAGVSAVAPEKLAGCQTFTQLITSLLPEFSAPFVCFYLNSEMARRYFDTTGWGSAQRNISVPILANTPMPCPPGDEQSRIAAYLVKEIAEVDGLLAAIKRRTDLAVERRSALVAAAVSGNLDVTTARGAA